jgi:hypothetical protein
MIKLSLSVLFAIIAIFINGCEKGSGNDQKDIIHGTGKVMFSNLEGGFYYIADASGKNYDPLNLPPDFQQDNINVIYEAVLSENQESIHMVGEIIVIRDIALVVSASN